MRRHEITDDAWSRLNPLMPADRHGERWNDHRVMFNGIFGVLDSGAPWSDMPDRYGKCESFYHCDRRWMCDIFVDRVLRTLQL